MNDYAIYSAVVGHYDKTSQPQVIDPRFDYILFSNDIKERQIGVWQVRPIPYHNDIPTRIARWVKTHPEELLPEYQYSLWIDANVLICGPTLYERSLALQAEGVLVSSMWHHQRNCIYDEAVEVMCAQREHELPVYQWVRILKKEHYPQRNGLFETNVLFRAHRHNSVREMDALWWNCIDNYSRRDQLSFCYALWKKGVECAFFLPKGQNVRNNPDFKHIVHDKGGLVVIGRKEDPFMNYYQKVHPTIDHDRLTKIHHSLFRTPCPPFFLTLLGQYYRMMTLFRR